MSEEMYESMTNDELITLYNEKMRLSETYNCRQLVEKILLNSLYGAMGSPYFVLYNKDIARSITLMGQVLINKSAKAKNEFIGKIMKEDNPKERRIYSDTDSVTGDTLIHVNDMMIPISEFYDMVNSSEDRINEKYVKECDTSFTTKNINSDYEIVEDDINYVMKHKQPKHLYEIIVDGKSVKVTEDHNLIVKRNGSLVPCRVNDIEEDDELIYY